MTSKNTRLPFALVFTVVIASCSILPKQRTLSAETLLQTTQSDSQSLSTLTADQVESDSEILIYALNHGYGGKVFVDRRKFDNAISKLRDLKKPLSREEFRDRIDEALLNIPDNHLVAKLYGQFSKQRIDQASTLDVGQNSNPRSDRAWNMSWVGAANSKMLLVSVSDFRERSDPSWSRFIPQLEKDLKRAKTLIIDLRGNRGGDDSTAREISKVILGGQFWEPVAKKITIQTAESSALRLNYFRAVQASFTNRSLETPDSLRQILKDYETLYRQATSEALPLVKTVVNEYVRINERLAFRGPVIILIDAKCASACEHLVTFLERLRSVTKMGTNTAGEIHFGNIGFVILPASDVQVNIPTDFNEFHDQRFIERVGIAPDIKITAGQDALKFSLEHLNQSKKKKATSR